MRADILPEFENGKSLSHILRERNISQYIVSRIAQGEKTGSMNIACEDIAQTLYAAKELRAKILTSLMYPCVLLFATSGIVLFLVMYIFPKMMPLFLGMKVTLPLTTRSVIFVSNTLGDYWWAILVSFCAVFFVAFIWRKQLEKYLLYIPLIKDWYLYQKVTTHFSRFASYMESGIGLDVACYECATMESSIVFKKKLLDASVLVAKGLTFSECIARMYPSEVVDMVMIGESSGKLALVSKKIEEIYREKFSILTKRITTMIEPLSMLVMGGLVGFISFSMITPLYSITQHV